MDIAKISDVEDDEDLFFQDVDGELNDNSFESKKELHLPKSKWRDEDDESLNVDLTSVSRLKKLRENREEDCITGSELSKRLRSFHGQRGMDASLKGETPSWALTASAKKELKEIKENRRKKAKLALSVTSLLENVSSECSSPETRLSTLQGDSNELVDELSNDDGDSDDDFWLSNKNEDSLLRSSKSMTAKPSEVLPRENISIARMPAVQYSHSSIVSAIEFHPTTPILVTTGLDGTLRLSQIDRQENPILSKLHFSDLPIHALALHPSGHEAFVVGRRSFSYTVDLSSGVITRVSPIFSGSLGESIPSLERMKMSKSGQFIAFVAGSGHIVIVDNATKKWITNLKMNGACQSISWSGDSVLTSVGSDGQVYVWDVGARRCKDKWNDVGAFRTGTICVSPTGTQLATGSHAGIVNMYQSISGINGNSPSEGDGSSDRLQSLIEMKAIRSVDNLTTPISLLQYNCDGQILAIASRAKKDQFKLVHAASGHVFSNWPSETTPLSYVQSTAFSPLSGLLAIGNDKGRVLLYKLKHYSHY
jgi:U3 small nucleolar RNA-associated protein 18